MGRQTPLTSTSRISEINLTPLMDVTFILLITFIMVFPIVEQGIALNLPKDSAAAPSPAPDSMVQVSVNAEGELFLGDRPMDLEALETELEHQVQVKPETSVWVRADENIPYKHVVEVLKVVKRVGIVNMSLVTQQE